MDLKLDYAISVLEEWLDFIGDCPEVAHKEEKRGSIMNALVRLKKERDKHLIAERQYIKSLVEIDLVYKKEKIRKKILPKPIPMEIKDKLEKLVSETKSLTDKENVMLSMRLGLKSRERFAYKEIAHQFKITPGYVSHICRCAIEKIIRKHPEEARFLKPYPTL